VLAAGNSIDPSLVTSRQEIGELARGLSAGKDVSHLRLMKGWRRRAVGEELIRLRGGEVEMQMRCDQGALRVSRK
jgi:hypothetical protein